MRQADIQADRWTDSWWRIVSLGSLHRMSVVNLASHLYLPPPFSFVAPLSLLSLLFTPRLFSVHKKDWEVLPIPWHESCDGRAFFTEFPVLSCEFQPFTSKRYSFVRIFPFNIFISRPLSWQTHLLFRKFELLLQVAGEGRGHDSGCGAVGGAAVSHGARTTDGEEPRQRLSITRGRNRRASQRGTGDKARLRDWNW